MHSNLRKSKLPKTRVVVKQIQFNSNPVALMKWLWTDTAKHPYTHGSIYFSHYNDVIMGAMASRITSLKVVFATVSSDADQGKHQSSASLAFVRGIHRGPVNSPHKWLVTRKMFPVDDVIMARLTEAG